MASRNGSHKLVDGTSRGAWGSKGLNSTPNPVVTSFSLAGFAALVLQAGTFQGQGQGADSDAALVRALAAYKDFLALWKDADPDVPILKEAVREVAVAA